METLKAAAWVLNGLFIYVALEEVRSALRARKIRDTQASFSFSKAPESRHFLTQGLLLWSDQTVVEIAEVIRQHLEKKWSREK